jgi:hypothetical protein
MKKAVFCTVLLFLGGCTTLPKAQPLGQNRYIITGESEFGFTELINSMYEEAKKTCDKEFKNLHILNRSFSQGSIGFLGTKRRYTLDFRCY